MASNGSVGSGGDAPPKQVAQAMDRLGRAGRLIAEIRLGADRILEALFLAAESPHDAERAAQLALGEEAIMRNHFNDLRALGKQLEESGVLSGALKSRGNSWGLHMPLVCPDGAVVAYAWKRQLAGQAGASAVDRARLALKAFTDQKRRYFPHLPTDPLTTGNSQMPKRPRTTHRLTAHPNPNVELNQERATLPDILKTLETELPGVWIFTYQRLDWLKRAEYLASLVDESSFNLQKDQNLRNSNNNLSEAGVIELLVPDIFRAVVSLHPAGSTEPDAAAFFSPNEGGSYIHARGSSVHHVFKHITEHAEKALQYFLSVDPSNALYLLLHWICSYQSIFTKACSKCGKLLMMDKSLSLILPPVHRQYRLTSKGHAQDFENVYHIGCSSYDV